MKTKKIMYIITNVILHLLGFPTLMIVALVKSLHWNSFGMYGVSSFTPLFVVLGLWVFVSLVQLSIYFIGKKHNKSYDAKMMVKLMIVPVLSIILLFGALDIAIPKPLAEGTQNTIFYEDVVFDYEGLNNTLVSKVNEFKRKNNIDENVKFEDEEFQKVFKPVFTSMNKAYNAFDQLAIDMALLNPDFLTNIKSGKLPISLMATLIVKTAPGNGNYHTLSIEEIIGTNINELEMALADLKEVDFNSIDTEKINEIVNKILVTKDFDGIQWNIFNILGTNPLVDGADPNAKIVAYKDTENEITYAALGYQDMSWINGLPQMFFIPLMSIRYICYIFGAILAFLTFAQYTASVFYKQALEKKGNK